MKIKNSEGRGFNGLIKPLVAATAIGAVGVALAITDAGTVIKNLATVTYTDSNGDDYTATSNEAQVTVANVFSADLANDNLNGSAAPGQTVYFPHVLTNTGNATDTYNLTAGDDTDGSATGTLGLLPAAYTIYLDENGNGQPDAGEEVVSSVTLDPDEVANLIVAVDVPVNAADGDIVDAVLTATSAGLGGVINDATASNGADGAEGTNQDAATVTLGPVLVSTKESVIVGNTITYTLTVKNVGGSAATDVDIFDTVPEGTTFTAITEINGLLSGSSDEMYIEATGLFGALPALPAAGGTGPLSGVLTDDFNEPTGIDMDGDGIVDETNGTVGEAAIGFVFRDSSLPANTTVSIVYTVDVTGAAAGAEFKNKFCAGQDITSPDADVAAPADGLGDATRFVFGDLDIAACSNETYDVIPFTYGVIADDDDVNAVDDNDDVTYRAEAPIGGTVDFVHSVLNDGTDFDVINVEVGANTFPAGTVFTFWEAGGLVPLTDNDGDGNADVGLLDPNEEVNFVVRAILPSTIALGNFGANVDVGTGGMQFADTGDEITQDAAGDYYVEKDGNTTQDEAGTVGDTILGNDATNGDVQIALTDAADAFENDELFQVLVTATSQNDVSQTDSTISALGKIVSAKVDLANGITAFTDAAATYAVGFNDDGTADAHATDPVIIYGDNAADDANFDAGGVNTASPVTGNAGTEDDAPVLAGQTITVPLSLANEGAGLDAYDLSSTAPAGVEVVFKDSAGNIITSTPAQSADEVFSYVAEITFTPEATAGTNDVTLTITSPTTGATDSLVDQFVLALSCDVEVSAAALQQVQAGGNVDYIHTVNNSSNGAVTFTFTPGTAPTGWTGVMVATAVIDVNNDSPGTTTDDIAAGDVIPSGQDIILPAGGSVTFIHRIFAPANASDAQTEVLTIDVASTECGTTTIEDVASVIVGQVRLEKLVSIDDNCDCVADDTFAVAGSAAIEPGDCAVWQLTATNEGDEDATNVFINDSLTEYTAFVTALTVPGILPGSDDAVGTDDAFTACSGAGCTPVAGTIAGGNLGGVDLTVTGEVLSYDVGTLVPGDSAVGTFCVQVQ